MKISLPKREIYEYVFLTLSLIVTFWFISAFELFESKSSGIQISSYGLAIIFKLVNDFWYGFIIGLLLFPLYFLIHIKSQKAAFFTICSLFIILVVIQFSLVKYSLTTLVNLGADLLGYSYDDIFSTVSVSESISILYFLPFLVFPLLLGLIYKVVNTYINHKVANVILISLFLVFGIIKLVSQQASQELYLNKTAYFTKDVANYLSDKRKLNAYNSSNRNDYPLLKPFSETPDVLSPFIKKTEEKPNIVFIVVEGLGSEFVDNNDYSGFTPYLDSLISKSLYWENFLSTTGRSFGILPSLFGSLPFGEKGFLELKEVPSHISLISVLKANGYQTSYYSGGPSSFDRKVNYLEYNGIDNLIDENRYSPEYQKTKSNDGGFSWGYPDDQIFKKALASFNIEKQPRLDIIMTLSNHEPFEYPEKDNYFKKVENIIKASRKSDDFKDQVLNNKDIFGCLLYTDDAIKNFMQAYSKRSDYKNTIFIITGDHRLIPLTQKDKLCRYHVPFLIYSPLLEKSEKFKSVSSHWDVTPSLLSYLKNNFKLNTLDKTAFVGKGLDTVKAFRNVKNIPLMRYKGSLNDMVYKDYLYTNGELFKINENFGTYKVIEEELLKEVEDSLMAFKKMNAYVTQRNKIFPDSINIYITPKVKFTEQELAVINTLTKDKTYDEVLTIAKEFSSNKKYETTRVLCDYILNEYPNYTDARILKGRTLAWEGDYVHSEEELLNALKRSPYYYDTYLAILDMYWWSGQEEKSEKIFKEALQNEVDNSELAFKMAKAFKRLKKPNKAEKVIDSIINAHPKNKEYLTFKSELN